MVVLTFRVLVGHGSPVLRFLILIGLKVRDSFFAEFGGGMPAYTNGALFIDDTTCDIKIYSLII